MEAGLYPKRFQKQVDDKRFLDFSDKSGDRKLSVYQYQQTEEKNLHPLFFCSHAWWAAFQCDL